MRILFIGDIVGKAGRMVIKHYIPKIKQKHNIDLVVANGENVSHGYGLSAKNFIEIKQSGVDVVTGGNHSFDKKDIIPLMDIEPILRPLNMYEETPGKGIYLDEKNKIAIISLMGQYGMPIFENPFRCVAREVEKLKGYSIFIDFHAESSAEKRVLFLSLKGKVAGIVGTHTHIGSDDLVIEEDSMYLSDVGLSGCFDNVIGMDAKEPIKRCFDGMSKKFDVNEKCMKIFQAVVFEVSENRCVDAFKIKGYDFKEEKISQYALRIEK